MRRVVSRWGLCADFYLIPGTYSVQHATWRSGHGHFMGFGPGGVIYYDELHHIYKYLATDEVVVSAKDVGKKLTADEFLGPNSHAGFYGEVKLDEIEDK